MDVRAQQTVIIVMVDILDEMDGSLQSIDCQEAVGLLMTYRCNLNCRYCYVHKKRDKRMTLEMAQSILEPFLMKREGFLNIAFMGGETLMAKDVIIPLIEWAEHQTWNRPYRFFGSTNGTLLDNSLKKWINKHKNLFTLGLSYDGIPFTQMLNRGSDNIDLNFFIQTWPKQPIQMTINAESVCHMSEGVIYLLEKGAVVHPNVAFENSEWSELDVVEYGRQLNKLIYYYMQHEEKPLISQFIHNLNQYAYCVENPLKQEEVCGAGNGFQVFDTDGKSYPCHILSPLVLEGEKLKAVQNGVFECITGFSDDKCLNCPYVSSCPTCIACNYIYRKSFRKRDITHCKIMKTEVRAFIKKEVLRLQAKQYLTPEDAAEIDSIRKLLNHQSAMCQRSLV